MRIQVPNLDAQSFETWHPGIRVIDADTQKIVGFVRVDEGSNGSASEHIGSPTRLISLFDGKYCGQFESHDECVAFAKGVEAVINHMTAQYKMEFVKPQKSEEPS